MDDAREASGAPVAQQSLTEGVYRALKEDILSARLGFDEQINESQLAQRFGVSKTPVREALRQLAHEGLVLVLPRKGYVVRSVSLTDVVEVLSLRRWIEPELAAQAARRRTPQQIEQLTTLVEREYDSAASVDELGISMDVHDCIAEVAGNRHARTFLRRLLDETGRIPWLIPRLNYPSAGEHAEIVQAIKSGDPQKAAQLMRVHLETTQQWIMAGLGGS
jgi:DNA-binding GntR family transcriptional regulator